MSKNAIFCPRCDSFQVVKNGFIHNGNQNFKCEECQRQFVRNSGNKVIGEETKDLIDKLLLEKLPLAGIARITGVLERWLRTYPSFITSGGVKSESCCSKKFRQNGYISKWAESNIR